MSSDITHSRDCPACGATTYQFERCHQCGDIPWQSADGGQGRDPANVEHPEVFPYR